MPFDAKSLADALLSAAYNAGGRLEARVHIGDWPESMVIQTVDKMLDGAATFKLRLKGIRTDAAGFAKLGIKYERQDNSGQYRDVPVVRAEVPFDTMQFVFEHQRS